MPACDDCYLPLNDLRHCSKCNSHVCDYCNSRGHPCGHVPKVSLDGEYTDRKAWLKKQKKSMQPAGVKNYRPYEGAFKGGIKT